MSIFRNVFQIAYSCAKEESVKPSMYTPMLAEKLLNSNFVVVNSMNKNESNVLSRLQKDVMISVDAV